LAQSLLYVLAVALNGGKVKELMPYIEKVARPGMEAVFLVPYPVDGMRWSHAELETQAVMEGKQLVDYYDWESNRQRAVAKVFPASEVLPARGIAVAVDVYAGSWRRAVKSHIAHGDVHLIVTGSGIGQRVAGVFTLFKRPRLFPVLLIHPETVG